MRRFALPVCLALAAVITGTLALSSIPGPDAGRGGSDVAVPITPVLSPRRAPEVFASVVGTAKLSVALDAALADPAYGGSSTCLTVEAGDDLVYARNADASLLPASTMKVLTGMAALRRWGPEHRFTTPLVAPGGVPPNGVIDGQAWLVGAGDPLLSTAAYAASFRNQPQVFTPLDALADAVVAAGVKEIRGGIAGDESRFDNVRYVSTWKPVYLSDNDIGPLSALSVNDGFTQFKPLVRKHAAEPAVHAASVLTELLRGRGVVVGNPSAGNAPPGAPVVASVESPPLSDIVGQLLRESDNMTAEILVKGLGAAFGTGGSWAAGLNVIRDTLAEANLPVGAFRAADGSGLDIANRLSCTLLMEALDLAGTTGPVAAGFPVAGQSGTLAARFRGTPAEGKLRAKTGSLNYVAGLAGFVESAGAGTLEFALLANDLPDRLQSGRLLQERVGAVLSTYPDVPPTDALEPVRGR